MRKRIIGARDTVRLGPRGELKRIAQYTYMLDDLGPFTFEIEKEFDSPEALKEAMREKEKVLEEAQK